MQEGGCTELRQRRLTTVVVAFLIGCTVLLLGVGCAGTSSETSNKKEQGSSPKTTASEEARCEGTSTTMNPMVGTGGGPYTTNDLPGCPNGGLLLGTDKYDRLQGKDGDDEIRALDGLDAILGGSGNDIIYAGPGDDIVMRGDYRYESAGDDVIYMGSGDDLVDGGDGADVFYGGDGSDQIIDVWDRQPDKLYCGKGKDKYAAKKNDYVDSSCEKKANLKPPPPPSSGPGMASAQSVSKFASVPICTKSFQGDYCIMPGTGGPAILLPPAVLLLGSGILTYAILRRR